MAEQAVIVTINFAGEDLEPVFELEELLSETLASAGCGECDGNLVGEGTCDLYMYGPDADSLFAAIEPVLRANELCGGARVVLRYGSAEDSNARERRLNL